MTNRELNQVNMFRTVRDWITLQLEVLGMLPNFTDTFEQYKTLLKDVDRLAAEQDVSTKGVTSTKASLVTALQNITLEVVKILKVYATFTNDLTLLNAVDFTPSQIKYVSEQTLLNRAGNILKEAQRVQSAVPEEYDLTVEKVASLKAARDAFSAQQSSTRQAVVNRRDAGEQLSDTIDETDDLLKEKLDVLMELAEIKHPELYNQYVAARVIVDRAA